MDPSNLKRGDLVRLANGDIELVLTVTEIITPAPSVNSRNTPPAIWPEPITDRPPTADDADADGDIQYMNAGGWFCHEFEPGADYEEGWQHTPMWKPRELDRKTRTIQALQAAVDDRTGVDLETLEVAIELLAGRE
jgi:hypothetical protein